MQKLYWRSARISRAMYLLASLIALAVLLASESFKETIVQPHYEEKLEAARLMQRAMEAIQNHRVRKVDASSTISTVAGTGTAGYSGDNVAATSTLLNFPCDVEVDASGNLLIADGNNHRIRRVDTSGTITTFAGNGQGGFLGDGGSATSARLSSPWSVEVDGAGRVYIADRNNHRVRRVDTSGVITTVAGSEGTAVGDGGLDGLNRDALTVPAEERLQSLLSHGQVDARLGD